jgi:nitroreductase
MELDDVLEKRRTIRKYMNIPVEKDKWSTLLDVSKFTPSAGNLQAWKIIVVRSLDNRERIAQICHNQLWMAQAPVHFIICADLTKAKYYFGKRGEDLFVVQDCAVLASNMMLKATDMGLSSSWIGAFDEPRLKHHFGIPSAFKPTAILTFGYGDEVVPAPPRCELRDITFFEQFGQMGSDFGNTLRQWRFGRAAKMIKDDLKTFVFDIFDRKKKKDNTTKKHVEYEGASELSPPIDVTEKKDLHK